MQEARVTLLDRIVKPCLQSCPGGRSFLRRLFDLSSTAKNLDRFICLSQSAGSPMVASLLLRMERHSHCSNPRRTGKVGLCGCGAITGGKWLQLKWAL